MRMIMRRKGDLVREYKKPLEEKNQFSKVKMVNPDSSVRYSESIEMSSHLYKLVEAPVKKYLGKGTDREQYPENTPENFLDMGHAHVFRTLDSEGNSHIRSVPIGGHYHLIELEYDKEDPLKAPKIVSMSEPMKMASKKVKGKTVLVDEPLNHYDFHVHDVAYIKSEKIQARATNTSAQLYMANKASEVPSAPAGVAAGGRR